jgi:hypothetical protein
MPDEAATALASGSLKLKDHHHALAVHQGFQFNRSLRSGDQACEFRIPQVQSALKGLDRRARFEGEITDGHSRTGDPAEAISMAVIVRPSDIETQ